MSAPSTSPPSFTGVLRSDFRSVPADLLTEVADDGSLVLGLESADPEVRAVAARGLAGLPSRAAGEALLRRLDLERDDGALAEACFALGQWADPRLGEPLTSLLAGHLSSRVRAEAAAALGKLADDRHTGVLVGALSDGDAAVRGAASLALFRLDGRRYDHPRSVSQDVLAERDNALAAVALRDPDAGARWRATYTLAEVPGRGGMKTVLEQCLRDADPRVRVFAARGLGALAREGLADRAPLRDVLWDDEDDRVVIEAAAALVGDADVPALIEIGREHDLAHVRVLAVRALPDALARTGGGRAADAREDGGRGAVLDLLWSLAGIERSPTVRRASLATIVVLDRDPEALGALARSRHRHDRMAAAALLAEGSMRDDATLDELLEDVEPMVRVAALGALGDPRFLAHTDRLHPALHSFDPAVRTAAAQAARPHVESGECAPRLLVELARSLEDASGLEMVEARQALQDALGLPRGPAPPPRTPTGPRLLDRLLALHEEALRDPRPRVWIETEDGLLTVELDRIAAPRHVAAFLELASMGFYDGLDFHRVVPNFVVQGLDPRGDGWGVGGRRLPDEPSPLGYDSFTVGMPNAGEPHTGGCQVFFTLVPTPHLDGRYTAFGRVIEGRDLLPRLEIGTAALSVRRIQ